MISIIIPVYDAQKTIGKCLESILVSSFKDFEIILINDGSADDSWKILQTYEKKYPDKIKIFNQENCGVAKTRNRGIHEACSEYIMFVDGDDWVDKDYLETFFEEIESKRLDVVIGGYRRTDEKKIIYEMSLQDASWSRYMIMAPWAKMYRRDFLLKNEIKFLDNNIGEDVYFNLQVINLTDKISILQYCGYNWFFNHLSVSNTNQKNIKNKIDVRRLLDCCYSRMREIGSLQKDEVEFYFVRYVVWYLLFIGRESGCELISEEYRTTFAWLLINFPQFQKNKNISLFLPQGETFKNRVAVWAFVLLHKLGMAKLFFKVYARQA